MPKKKKKKSKKKSGSDVPDLQDLEVGSSRIQFTKSKGRHVVATRDCKVGDLVWTEEPFAFVVRSQFREHVCGRCLAQKLSTKVSEGKEDYACKKCKAWYCGSICQDFERPLHTLTCSFIADVHGISAKHSVDLDLLRLALEIEGQSHLHLEGSTEPDRNSEVLAPRIPSRNEVNSLLVHADQFSGDWRRAVKGACRELAEAVVQALPACNATKLFDNCCRINVNAHGLKAADASNRDVAVALLFVAALANHSCEPNIVISNSGGIAQARVIREIQAGQEISQSYIDLYESRAERQKNLKATKFFTCRCRRCAADAKGQNVGADSMLEAFMCPERECLGYLPKSTRQCVVCNKSVSEEAWEEAQSAMTAAWQEGLQAYRAGQATSCRRSLERLMGHGTSKQPANPLPLQPHPYNTLVVEARTKLVNVHQASPGEWLQSPDESKVYLEHLSALAAACQAVFGAPHWETANYYFHLARTHVQLMQFRVRLAQDSGNDSSRGRAQRRLHQEQAIKAYKMCLNIRQITHGSDHEVCAEVRRLLDEVKSDKIP
eukprot:g71792.t1